MSVSSFKPPKDVNEEGDDEGSRSEGGTPRGGADLPLEELDIESDGDNKADKSDEEVLDSKHSDKNNKENKINQDSSDEILEKDKSDDSSTLSDKDEDYVETEKSNKNVRNRTSTPYNMSDSFDKDDEHTESNNSNPFGYMTGNNSLNPYTNFGGSPPVYQIVQRTERPRMVDPKRVQAIKKGVPVCTKKNFQNFKEALEEVGDSYDWPEYILSCKAKEWDSGKKEEPTERVARKEAYLVIWDKIHNDLKDHVKDDTKRGNAQHLFRRLRQTVCRNNADYALEVEAKLTSIFTTGCSKINVIQYGVAIKTTNDELKALDQGFGEAKLVLLYKKGLPNKLNIVSIKLKKEKYNTLQKARNLIEEYVRDQDIDQMTYPYDFKYLSENDKQSRREKRDKNMSKVSEKSPKQGEKQSQNNSETVSTKKGECWKFKEGKCEYGKKCKFLHVANSTTTSRFSPEELKKIRAKKPCFSFPKCEKKDCPYSHDPEVCQKGREGREGRVEHQASLTLSVGSESLIEYNRRVMKESLKSFSKHRGERNAEFRCECEEQKHPDNTKGRNVSVEQSFSSYTSKSEKMKIEDKEQEKVGHVVENVSLKPTVREVVQQKILCHKENDRETLKTPESLSEKVFQNSGSEKTVKYCKEDVSLQMSGTQRKEKHRTILDSGAMTHSVKFVSTLDTATVQTVTDIRVLGVGGVHTHVKHKGDWVLPKNEPIVTTQFRLKNVLVLPGSNLNIVSVPKLSQAGFVTAFYENHATVSFEGQVVLKAYLEDRLFVLKGLETIEVIECYPSEVEKNLVKTHQQLGHMNFDFVRTTLGIEPKSDQFPNPKCESCDQSKLPELRREAEATTESNKKGYSIHMDISPEHPPATDTGETRVVEFVDEHTKYIMLSPCTYKSDAYHVIKDKITEVEAMIAPDRVSRVRSDGARELVKSKRLKSWYAKRGIRLMQSAPYHQYQNGLIERMVRTINEGARAMMLRANSPEGDWLLAKNYFVWLRNHFFIPSGQVNTPALGWYRVDSAVLPEGIFGCKVLAKVYVRKKSGKPQEEKKTRACVFLGKDEICKAYLVRPYDKARNSRALRYAKTVSFYIQDYPYTHPDVPKPKTVIRTVSDSEEETDSSDDDADTDTDATIEVSSDSDSDSSDIEQDSKKAVEDSKIDTDPTEEFVVHKLLKRKKRDDVFYYNVRWEGDWKDTWEPAKNLNAELVSDFDKLHPIKSTPVDELDHKHQSDVESETDDTPVLPSAPRRSQRLTSQTAMVEICNNFTFKKKEIEQASEHLTAENIFKSRKDELEELYKKVGREIDPKNNKQQENSPYRKFWDEAFLAEFMALKELGVFELTRRSAVPNNKAILRPVIVRKTKMCQHEDKIDKHKVRICADGSSQQIDPIKTFAPTVVFHSVMIVLMIACHFDLDLECLDIKNFYVRCDMGDEEVYIEQIPGWEEAARGEYLYRIRKAIYGTKSASRKAQKMLTKMMIEAKFEPLKSDPMIFARIENITDYKIAIVCAWSDDLLCTGSKDLLCEMRETLHKHKFETVRTEEPRSYTGIQIDRDRSKRSMKIHQTQYTKEMLHRLKVFNPQQARSPMLEYNTDMQLKDTVERKTNPPDPVVRREYQQKCGGLMWLNKTRPDIAFAVSVACRGMQNPLRSDLVRIKRILDYVAHTPDIGIVWQVQKEFEELPVKVSNHLSAKADSDFAARIDNSRSTSGYYLQFADTGMLFAVSQLQKIVTLSTTHAELVCACECTKTVEWCKGFLGEIGLIADQPTIVKQDNKPCIDLSHNPVYHFRTRHFRIAQHYLRSLVENKVIMMEYTKSNEMTADFLNKTQPPSRHVELRIQCMNN
jgi:6-pyruvoyl-tetrahydropterin synthase